MASEENLRVEYQAAQDSAQHHDTIAWTLTSVMWGGSLVLMGLSLGVLKETSLRTLVIILAILGILLTIVVLIFFFQRNSMIRHK